MNYTPQILDYLAKAGPFAELILAPQRKPLQRTETGFIPVGDQVLSDADVRETLSMLLNRVSGNIATLEKSGVHSFGIAKVGRFRLSYVTQRGSYVVSLTRIAYEIPDLADLVPDADALQRMAEFVRTRRSGLLVVTGASAVANNALVYSLLKRLSETEERVIYILEDATSFLLSHGRSVVVQCEVGRDTSSIEKGLAEASPFMPDVLYLRDVTSREQIHLVTRAVGSEILTIITVSVLDGEELIPFARTEFGSELICGVWRVYPEKGGKVRVSLK
jgi:twitching motility protein PilT